MNGSTGGFEWLSCAKDRLMRFARVPGLATLFATLTAVGYVNSQDPELILKMSDAVAKMCSVPSDSGTYFRVEGGGEIKGGAGLILRFIEGNVAGSISQEEWQGVRDVLEKDRATDRISSRDCVMRLTPIFLRSFGLDAESQSLLDRETLMQKSLSADNPAGRLVAFREAFKSVQVFFVDLKPENTRDSQTVDKEIYYENSLSKIITRYDFDTGQFRDDKRQDQYALSGQINQDSVTFRNNYCVGRLHHQPGTWSFIGPVSCKRGKYEGVFRLK